MLLQVTHADFMVHETRDALIGALSDTVDAGRSDMFTPYSVNDNTDLEWVLDAANNWRVVFNPASPNRFAIHYRYQSVRSQGEEALAAWLGFKLGAIPVAEVSGNGPIRR